MPSDAQPPAAQSFVPVDEIGPEKVVFLHDPLCGMKGLLVIDNTAIGTAIGGVRMAPDVTLAEVMGLARAMTYKNAAAGLRLGGGKAAILADPEAPDKERLVRAFARAIAKLDDYCPGPDMGTDERAMAWIHDEIGRAAGLPRVLGGIPLDSLGMTGFGLRVAARIAAKHIGLDLNGARVAVQGYGNVGRAAGRFLRQEGALLVGASDVHCAVADPAGLDEAALWEASLAGRPLSEAGTGHEIPREDVLWMDCDVLIPAARPDAITLENEPRVRARLILQGANIPITPEAERALHDRGVLNIPDFIANAGGIICIAMERQGLGESQAFAAVEEKIAANTAELLRRVSGGGLHPRQAAEQMARGRVLEAMEYRNGR